MLDSTSLSPVSTKRGLRRWGEKLLYTDIAQGIND